MSPDRGGGPVRRVDSGRIRRIGIVGGGGGGSGPVNGTALALARSHPPRVDRGDAGDWLPARLAEPCNHGRLVYHTVAAQYFPAATRALIEAALQAAGAQASPERPLAHLSMEADGGEGAALALRLWAGGGMRQRSLGRADFHARWIDWQPKET